MPPTSFRARAFLRAFVFAALAACVPLVARAQATPAPQDTSVRVRLQWANADHFFEDTRLLTGLAGDTLLLVPLNADDVARVPFASMSRIDLGGESHGHSRSTAMVFGAIGLLCGAVLGSDDLATGASNSGAPILTAVGVGVGFALVGAVVGALFRTPSWRRATPADLERALAVRRAAPPGAAPAASP